MFSLRTFYFWSKRLHTLSTQKSFLLIKSWLQFIWINLNLWMHLYTKSDVTEQFPLVKCCQRFIILRKAKKQTHFVRFDKIPFLNPNSWSVWFSCVMLKFQIRPFSFQVYFLSPSFSFFAIWTDYRFSLHSNFDNRFDKGCAFAVHFHRTLSTLKFKISYSAKFSTGKRVIHFVDSESMNAIKSLKQGMAFLNGFGL